ncbi:MAG TPA: GNAT family N-acetyltransferase [Roseiflexaceae bacterium]|nr:GNAT family N-acetyltransferase [Roseiflexaceae bacterium]
MPDRLRIRPFVPADRPALDALLGAVWGDQAGAAAYYRPAASSDQAGAFCRTLVAEHADGAKATPVGLGTVEQRSNHPQPVYLTVAVHPQQQGRGVGGALYARLAALAVRLGTRPWQTATGADQGRGLAFLERRGFRQTVRTIFPRFTVAEVDLSGRTALAADLERRGFRVAALPELAGQPGALDRLADLHHALYAAAHPHNPPGPALYARRHAAFLGDDLLPEAMFVALRGGEWVGAASLRPGEQPSELEMALFGVLDSAAADRADLLHLLKLHEFAYARAVGAEALLAEIDSVDPHGLAALRRFPFREDQPAWLTFRREAQA